MIGWIIAFLILVILILLFIIKSRNNEIKYIQGQTSYLLDKKEELISLLRYDMAKLCNFTRYQVSEKSQEEFRFYFEMYGAADFDIPNDVYFINTYVPVKGIINAEQPYGDYTVYIPSKGTCYHTNRFCSSSFNQAVHIYDVAGLYRPCPKCAIKLLYSPPEWYLDIKRIMENNKHKQ